MGFYWIKTNKLIKRFSNYYWDIPNKDSKIYLTFDDGPTPEITEWVLSELKKEMPKLLSFVLAITLKNTLKFSKKVINEGHVIGNHTYDHLKGWETTTEAYLSNSLLCDKQIQESSMQNVQSKIFRPPYGKITKSQSTHLRQLGYKIIMWDVLSADFDQSISPEKCLQNVIKNVKSGSVIVFHDSIKASQNLKFALPKTLDYLKENNFIFDVIY